MIKKFLILTDTYGWAWDIAGKELLASLADIKGRTVDVEELRNRVVNPDDYDVILVYPWAFNVISILPKDKTIIVIAGGEQLAEMEYFRKQCSEFKFYGACSRKIQKFLQGEFPDKKIFLLSHGVDTKLFTPSPANHKGFTIGWVGVCDRKLKRFPLAQAIAYELGIDLSVAGFKDRDHFEMPGFYNSIDCLLVTSVTEAHPLIVYEAMSCGIPVITTDVGDVDEYIVNAENGFILPISAPRIVFTEILRILKSNHEFREKIGYKARQTILNKLTWESISKQYTHLPKLLERE